MVDSELQTMIHLDEQHWWYRGRRRVIRAVLDGVALAPDCSILDAGCGSGRTLDELRDYGAAHGLDRSPAAVAAARSRGHDVSLGTIEVAPYETASFDLVTCLDVLEHTPDERRTLGELRRICRPGATLLLTLPAYQALWSEHDVVNQHYRRYTATRLRTVAADCGWELVRDTYFNSILLAPAATVRLAQRLRPSREHASDLTLTSRRLDAVLELPLRIEAQALRAGARLPAGLSLLAVFRAAPVTAVPAVDPQMLTPRRTPRTAVAA